MSVAKPKSRTYRVVAVIVKAIIKPFTRRVWRGFDSIPEGGVIVAANHMTGFDPLTTAHSLYDNGRAPVIMAKDSLFRVPVLGFVLKRTNMIPVYRGTARAGESLETAKERLRQGEAILVFPEGTLTKDPDLWPMVAKTGVARLALQTSAPLVPIAQWGTQQILPRGKGFPRLLPRKTVTVVVGDPVDLDDLRGKPVDSMVLREATARLMSAITTQLAEIRGETPPAELFDPRKKDTT